jgi:ArsR family transcriptional regulator
MCDCKCQYPEKLVGKPEECTPEQIKECHGDKEHPCEDEKE